MQPFPIIHLDLCTGCHRCVDICPTHALAQIAGKAQLAYPDQCTYCTACEDICPEDAIELPFLVVFATDVSATEDISTTANQETLPEMKPPCS